MTKECTIGKERKGKERKGKERKRKEKKERRGEALIPFPVLDAKYKVVNSKIVQLYECICNVDGPHSCTQEHAKLKTIQQSTKARKSKQSIRSVIGLVIQTHT
jgi:hypothetical protein